MTQQSLSLQFVNAAVTLLEEMQHPYQTETVYVAVTGGGPAFLVNRLTELRTAYQNNPLSPLHPLSRGLVQETIHMIEHFASILPGFRERDGYRSFAGIARQTQIALNNLATGGGVD